MKIEHMPIKITRSNNNINKKKLLSIFCDIVDRENAKECNEEGDLDEEECVPSES